MKNLIAALLGILITICTANAFAAEWSWSKEDTIREVVSLGLTVVDYGQTNNIRKHDGMIELNPILGRQPTLNAIKNYFHSVLWVHPLISAALPSKAEIFGYQLEPRKTFQWVYIGVEATTTVSNYRGGLRMSF